MSKVKPQKIEKLRSTPGALDTLVYWLVQLALSALAVSGILFFLQPVENAISYPIAGLLVGFMLYISYKNR